MHIVPSAKGIKGSIEKSIGGDAEEGGKKAGEGIASSIKKAIVAAGIGKVIKDALMAGGALEQAYGGLETIYGEDAARQAKEYAEAAAEAGISANTYAEQAVSFGAALKQAYKGDTIAAMEAANVAIMDMADNSAKMGTEIGSVQAAYQGFAKQNYTMLDNLKLGYGGTKTEMQRLLQDAEKLSGVKYNINNLGDVYQAIHVIQENLGLTGVAADEAKTTLTGSAEAMKASWENVMAVLTSGQGDLGQAMESLGTNLSNFFSNVLRMAGNIVQGLPELFSGVMSSIGPQLLPLVTGMMDSIINGITTGIPQAVTAFKGIFTGITNAVTTNLPTLLSEGTAILNEIISGILQAIPELATAGKEIIPQLMGGIVTNIPSLVSGATQLVKTILVGIIDALPELLTAGADIVLELISGIIENLPSILQEGVTLITTLAEGILSAIGVVVGTVPEIYNKIKEKFLATDWAQLGKDLLAGIANGIRNGLGTIGSAISDAANSALSTAKKVFGIGSPSKLFRDEIGKWIPEGVAIGIDENLKPVEDAITNMGEAMLTDYRRMTANGVANNSNVEETEKIIDALKNIRVKTDVTLTGSTRKIFRVVNEENQIRTRQTGNNALAGAGA